MKTALMFSGQGSQYVGMGSTLSLEFPEAHDVILRADEALGYSIGEIMRNGPPENLTQTRHTQAALFVHESAVLAASDADRIADAVAGHSLGEYTALYAAGVLSFQDALVLVKLRGDLMYEAGLSVPGTMAAIVGLSDDQVQAICNELNGTDGGVIVPANFNSPGQVVVSGSADLVRKSMTTFRQRGARIVKELQVSGAFHSPLLNSAYEGLKRAINSVTFNDARIDVYVNVSGEREHRAEALREALTAQLTSPVLWTRTIQTMYAHGVRRFIEVGPGGVLQGLVKRTVEGVDISGIDTAENVRKFINSMSGAQ